MRVIHHVSRHCQDNSYSPFYSASPSPPSHRLSPTLFYFPHINPEYLGSFPRWWTQVEILFVNPSCGQHIGWVAAVGFLGLSHSAVQGMTTAIARGRRDLAPQTVECGAVMAEMAQRAHFTPPSEWLQISCTALLIGNTFETSFHDHTYGVQKKEPKSIKNEVQSMTKSTELILDLTNGFFKLLFFQTCINHKCAEFGLKQL